MLPAKSRRVGRNFRMLAGDRDSMVGCNRLIIWKWLLVEYNTLLFDINRVFIASLGFNMLSIICQLYR